MLEPRIQVLVGTTGSGKTYRAVEIIKPLPRLFILNPTGADEPKLEALGVYCERKQDMVTLAHRTEKFCLRSHDVDEEDFEFVCELAHSVGDCTIMIDELALFCSPNYLPTKFGEAV